MSWENVERAQQEMKVISYAINNVFQSGAEEDTERVWSAKELRSPVIPMLKFLGKDHKPTGAKGPLLDALSVE